MRLTTTIKTHPHLDPRAKDKVRRVLCGCCRDSEEQVRAGFSHTWPARCSDSICKNARWGSDVSDFCVAFIFVFCIRESCTCSCFCFSHKFCFFFAVQCSVFSQKIPSQIEVAQGLPQWFSWRAWMYLLGVYHGFKGSWRCPFISFLIAILLHMFYVWYFVLPANDQLISESNA